MYTHFVALVLALAASGPNIVSAQAPTNCFSLRSTVACGEFSDYMVLPDTTTPPRFTDLASFDRYVQTTSGSSSVYQTFFRAHYACPTWDGLGLRYPQSFFCGFLVDSSMRLGCAKPAAAKPLCKATAATTIGSYQSIFSNTKFCTPGVPHTLDAQTTAFAASLPETPASGCILALRSETAMCGFSTTPELTAFCSAASSSTEGCCIAARAAGTLSANGTAANGTTTSSDPANSPGSGTLGSAGGGPGSEGITSSSPNSTNISSSAVGDGSGASSKPNLYMVIIGIVCGVVVLALVAIVIFLVRRRKSNNKVLEANIPETVQVAETMQVIYDYAANLFDELELHIGDNVIVKCKFDDGWAFGFNMSTKQEGSFPMACVASIQTQRDSLPPLPADGMTDRIRQRASSLYAPNPNIQY